MGLYSKGTRSKGVTKAFQKQNQANTLQRTKHQKRDAFLEKERFMKEAMAKHLAVQTTMVANAVEGAGGVREVLRVIQRRISQQSLRTRRSRK